MGQKYTLPSLVLERRQVTGSVQLALLAGQGRNGWGPPGLMGDTLTLAFNKKLRLCRRDMDNQGATNTTYPAAKTLPSVEKAQHRPLVKVATWMGQSSLILQNLTILGQTGQAE